jgi:lipopolysaccharide export LptBFGC system permease protein LptF
VAEALSKNTSLPVGVPLFMIWLPNLLFIGLGVWLFSRLARR